MTPYRRLNHGQQTRSEEDTGPCAGPCEACQAGRRWRPGTVEAKEVINRRSPALLLVILAVPNLAPWPLQQLGWVDATLAHYALYGVAVAALCMLLMPESARVWWLICAFGAIEGLMCATCGALYLVAPVLPGPFEGMCDKMTGLPFTAVCLTIWAILAAGVFISSMTHRP